MKAIKSTPRREEEEDPDAEFFYSDQDEKELLESAKSPVPIAFDKRKSIKNSYGAALAK